MQPITPLQRTEENIRYFKEKSCSICLEDDFNALGGAVQHCNGHVFHAECIDEAIEKNGYPLCPVCTIPLEQKPKPLTWKEKIDWVISIQPWLFSIIYKKDRWAYAVISFSNASMGLVDLYLSGKKFEIVKTKFIEIEKFLARYDEIQDPSPKQKSLKLYYNWLKPRIQKAIRTEENLSCFHLARSIITFVSGVRSLLYRE